MTESFLGSVIGKNRLFEDKAWQYYVAPLDDYGTRPVHFLSKWDLFRLGNKLAGGPGLYLEPQDFLYLYHQDGGDIKAPLELIRPQLESKTKRKSRFFFPEERVCEAVLQKSADATEALAAVGAVKEKVEPLLLMHRFSLEELIELVSPDGEKVQCCLCESYQLPFQPLKAIVIGDLEKRPLASIDDLKKKAEITGSWVASGSQGRELQLFPYHGSPIKIDKDQRREDWEKDHQKSGFLWLLREWQNDNRKSHLGKGRIRATLVERGIDQKKVLDHNGQIKNEFPELAQLRMNQCVSREIGEWLLTIRSRKLQEGLKEFDF